MKLEACMSNQIIKLDLKNNNLLHHHSLLVPHSESGHFLRVNWSIKESIQQPRSDTASTLAPVIGDLLYDVTLAEEVVFWGDASFLMELYITIGGQIISLIINYLYCDIESHWPIVQYPCIALHDTE